MKRYWIGGVVIALVVVLAYFIYDRASNADPIDDYSTWTPTSATLQQEMATPEAGVASNDEAARQDHFSRLFQSRFRQHEPRIAVGLRFMPSGRIKLMCPARMEPWNMDHLAMQAWKESKITFQHPFDIDIFETYIGAAPLKVGELRTVAGHPDTVHIVYKYNKKRVAANRSLQGLPMPQFLSLHAMPWNTPPTPHN